MTKCDIHSPLLSCPQSGTQVPAQKSGTTKTETLR